MVSFKLQALLCAVMTAMVASNVIAASAPPACQVLTPGGRIVDNTYFKKTTAARGIEKFQSTIKNDENTVVTFVPGKGAAITRSAYGGPLKIKLVSNTGDKVYVQVQLSKTCTVGSTVGWASIGKVDYFSVFYDD